MIKAFPSGPLATNAYVIADGTKRAVLIDPSPGCLSAVIDYVERNDLLLEKILLTHSHWDHIADCAAAKEHFRVPVGVHPEDVHNLENPGSDGIPSFLTRAIRGVRPDFLLQDGQVIQIGELDIQVLHTPGHCPGLVCFYCEKEKFLICGDLLFAGGGMGTLAIPTAEPERMWISLRKVSKLPAETKIYPGHGQSTTIGNEIWLADL